MLILFYFFRSIRGLFPILFFVAPHTLLSNKEITHFKPRGKFIYIERKELDDVLRRNVIYSKYEMSRRAAAESMTDLPKRNHKARKGAVK